LPNLSAFSFSTSNVDFAFMSVSALNYNHPDSASPDGAPFVYDLFGWMAADWHRCQEITQLSEEFGNTMKAIYAKKSGVSSKHALEKARRLFQRCGYNFGLLVPGLYPTLDNGKPMSLNKRPFMHVMTCLAPGYTLTLKAGRQIGKCVTGDTEVTTAEGSVSMRYLFAMGVAASEVNRPITTSATAAMPASVITSQP
jgi:hypothetical protein